MTPEPPNMEDGRTTNLAVSRETRGPFRTLLRATHVIGYRQDDHVILRDAQVVFAEDRIEFVGYNYAGHVDRVIDAGRAVICPGFIDLNALADVDHALLDTWHCDPGLQWSGTYVSEGTRDVFDKDVVAKRRKYALVQLIRNGITTAMPIAAETHNAWAETYDEMMSVAEAARSLGLRMYLGPSYRSGVNVVDDDGIRTVAWRDGRGEVGLEMARRFLSDVSEGEDDLVQGCLLPCRIETVSKELLARTRAVQEQTGCLVRIHCQQDPEEIRLLHSWYGQTPLEVLDESGLLTPRLLIPHGTHVGGYQATDQSRRREIELMAKQGVTVVHCPLTSARYGEALDSFDVFRAAGVRVVLGTDSFPPDLIRGMDYGNNISKLLSGRVDAGAAADYFRACTLRAADALGRPDLGRLTPGAKADITVVDLNDARIGAIDDPIRTMTMQADGTAVRTVVINGRIVMEDRQLPGVDLDRMHDWVQGYFRSMKAAYGERDYLRRDPVDLFPTSFPELTLPDVGENFAL